MGDTTDKEVVQDSQRPAAGVADGAEHHSRGRRRDGSGGKQHGQTGAEAGGRDPAIMAAVAEALGDARPTDGQLTALEAAVKKLMGEEQAKVEETMLRLTRTQADFANYKRRNEQEREQQAQFATILLVSELLPVLDNLDRALTTLPESMAGLPWTDGLLLVDRQLRGTLEKQGLKPIDAVGARFDPMLHEAIIHEETSEHADDEVIAELRRGYMLHDKVVRPSLVKVAKHVEPVGNAPEES